MRTEHVKRNIDINKQFAKLILRTAFFMFVRFPLSSFCFALSIKKNINKKGDVSQ